MTDAILGFGLAFTLEDKFTETCKNIRNEFATFAGDAAGFQAKMNTSMDGIKQGFGMMGAGVAMLAPLGIAVKDAANFEVQLKELSAITGVTGTGLEDIGNRAQNLALKFGGDPLKSVDSFKTILSRLGPDIAKSPIALQNMGDSIETLAKTMGGDTLGSVNALTTGMLQYSIDLSDPIAASQAMAKQMNVMAAAAQVGSAEVPQIAAALKVSGLAAKSAGLSFEEANAAIQIMGKGTVYGAEAGTALRNVLGKLGENRFIPKDTSEELKKAGVNLNVLADTTIPLSSRLKELNKIQNDSALVGKFFGVENKNAAMLLMQNIGDLEQWTKSVTGTNSATDQAAVIMESFNEAMKRNKASIEVTSIVIGTALLPAASKMLNIVSDLLGAFTEFAQSDIGKEFVKIAGAIGVGLVGMGSLVVGYHSINMAITAAKPAMEWFKASILTTNAALLPYIAVAANVAVVTYGMVKAYDNFSKVIESGGFVKGRGFVRTLQQVGGVLHSIVDIWNSVDTKSNTFEVGNIEALKTLGIDKFVINLGYYIAYAKEFWDGFTKDFDKLLQPLNMVKAGFSSLFDTFGNIYDRIANSIGLEKTTNDAERFYQVGQFVFQAVNYSLTRIAATINTIIDAFVYLIDTTFLWWDTTQAIFQSIGKIADTFKNDITNLPSVLFKEVDIIGNLVTNASDKQGAMSTNFVNARNIESQQLSATLEKPKEAPLLLNQYMAQQNADKANAMYQISNDITNLPVANSNTSQQPIIVNVKAQIGEEEVSAIMTKEQEYQDKRKN